MSNFRDYPHYFKVAGKVDYKNESAKIDYLGHQMVSLDFGHDTCDIYDFIADESGVFSCFVVPSFDGATIDDATNCAYNAILFYDEQVTKCFGGVDIKGVNFNG